MTYPVPEDLKARYEHLLAVRNNTETYRYFPCTYNFEAALIERIAKSDADHKILERALENTVEKLNDLADDISGSRSYFRSYYAYQQIEEAKKQIDLRICNHDIRLPHECRDCFDILSDEMTRKGVSE